MDEVVVKEVARFVKKNSGPVVAALVLVVVELLDVPNAVNMLDVKVGGLDGTVVDEAVEFKENLRPKIPKRSPS